MNMEVKFSENNSQIPVQFKSLQVIGNTPEIPDRLPNPNKLTFTGAVTAEYDGSEPVSVEIPAGSGDGIAIVGAAEVGQTIVVKSVDESGKPTEWETAELKNGMELIADVVTTEEVTSLTIDLDSNGDAFDLLQANISLQITKLSAEAIWYFTSSGKSSYVELAPHSFVIVIRATAHTIGAPVSISDTWGTETSRVFREWAEMDGITSFGIKTFDNVPLPVGTKVRIVGVRK